MHKFIKKLLKGEKVEWKKLGDICFIKAGDNISKKVISENLGEYPVINSGKSPLGFCSLYNTENDPLGITTRGTVGLITWQEGKYFRGNLNYSLTPKNKTVLSRFLFHLLNSMQHNIHEICSFSAIPALNSSDLKELIVPIPSSNVQIEIIDILDKFFSLKKALETERELRLKQYTYYRDTLLMFGEEVLFKTLGEVAPYSKTRISVEYLNENNYVGVDNLLQNRLGKTISTHVPTTGKVTEYKENDILIGNIRPYLKKIYFAKENGGASGDVLVIHPIDKNIYPRFLFHVLSTDDFFIFDMQNAKSGKMPRGDKKEILTYPIPLPPIERQKEIADILDKFEHLTNDLTQGLPKEIELREKQYCFYRDLLLDFTDKEY